MGNPPTEEPAEGIGAAYRPEFLPPGKGVPVFPPQAEVRVTARAGPVRGELGHEGDADPHLLGDLLQTLLVDGVAVRHGEDVGITDVELVLPETPLALGVLDRYAGTLEVAAHRAGEGLLARSLKDMVVLDVPAGRLETIVVLAGGLAVGVIERVVLELRARHGRVAS